MIKLIPRGLVIKLAVIFLALVLTGPGFLATVSATGDIIEQVNFDSNGNRISLPQSGLSASDDGRFILFGSHGITYLRDREQGATTVVTTNSVFNTDTHGTINASYPMGITPDGRYVLFSYVYDTGTPLDPRDTDQVEDIYLLDRSDNTTRLVSTNSDGVKVNGHVYDATITPDAHYMAFESAASNLISGQINDGGGVYVKNLVTGEVVQVADYTCDSNSNSLPRISADGRFVSYTCNNGSQGLFVYDMQTGSTEGITSLQFGFGNTEVPAPSSISNDGRYIVFSTPTPNVVLGDQNSFNDVFLYDRVANTIKLISNTSDGQQSDNNSYDPQISGDGKYIVYTTVADNLINPDTNGAYYDVLDYEIATGVTRLVDTNNVGVQGDADSEWASITTDGQYISFISTSDNLVPGMPTSGDQWGENVFIKHMWVTTDTIDNTPPALGTAVWTANPVLQGQATTLSVPISDNLSGVSSVQCTIDGGIPQPMTYDAASNTWQAIINSSSLAASTYNIDITATDNAGNTTGPMYLDTLAVYSTSNGYVTGHGKSTPTTSDTLPIALDTSKNPADLVLGFTNATAPTSGSFDVNYVVKNKQDEFSLSSTAIDWLVVQDSTHASLLGQANMTTYVNGVQTVVQNVSIRFDITLGTDGAPDHITMKMYDPGVNPNASTPSYVVSDDLNSNSNLMIHP